jgi:hypothetical protein
MAAKKRAVTVKRAKAKKRAVKMPADRLATLPAAQDFMADLAADQPAEAAAKSRPVVFSFTGPGPAVFKYKETGATIGVDRNSWRKHWEDAAGLVLKPRTRLQRLSAWMRRHSPDPLLATVAAFAFAVGYVASQIISGLIVADACRETASFNLLGQVYTCAIGR